MPVGHLFTRGSSSERTPPYRPTERSTLDWYLEPWKKYGVFTGRARRKEFWVFSLGNLVLYVALGFLAVGVLVLPGSGVLLRATAGASSSGVAPASTAMAPRQFLDTYCVSCHSEKRKGNFANLALDSLDVQHLAANAEIWEKVVKKLRLGAMPPVRVRRPSTDAYEEFLAWLERGLDSAVAADPDPGRVPIHRLNRLQYTNAIRDLFGVEIDGQSMLPADDTGYGFDNIADVLTMSPALLDRYLITAAKISRLVAGEVTRPSVTTYTLPRLVLGQHDRMSELLLFGSRGGAAISHYFPADGEYSLRLFLQETDLTTGNIPRGLDVVNLIDVRLDRQRINDFTVGGVAVPVNSNDAPKLYQGVGDAYDPAVGLEVRLRTSAGTHTVGVSFARDMWVQEGLGISRLPLTSVGNSQARATAPERGRIDAGLYRVDIAGPFAVVPAAARLRTGGIFICRPSNPRDEEPCAREIMTTEARRAYRRPVTQDDVAALMNFYRREREVGSFESGLRAAIEAMLVDVDFLFRLERDPVGIQPGTVYRVSDLELASRLSFFLWSSIPDDELLDLASRGELRNPGVLEQQVRRMLADHRAAAFVESFFGQWLTTRNIASHQPDPKAYPQFDENLRAAFQEETRLFLEYQLKADRPSLELFTADYTFANERLARHYGIPHVYGSHSRRVALPDDARGGLLGHGSVLTVTSYVDRTSVVVRGKWILETLFGMPPPPPPAGVPPLEATKITGTLRQRMELHRKNVVCATCHSLIDPLGFALENFDGIGTFRTIDGGAKVGPSGVLIDGTEFSGSASFRQALMRYSVPLLTNLTERLLTYAVGRGVEPDDMPVVRQIVREAAPTQHRWSALILGIVKSMPFQMRRAES